MKNRNTIGMDMGDRSHSICALDHRGEVISRNTVGNTAVAFRKCFKNQKPALFAIEAGTHSVWVNRLLEAVGHFNLQSLMRRHVKFNNPARRIPILNLPFPSCSYPHSLWIHF